MYSLKRKTIYLRTFVVSFSRLEFRKGLYKQNLEFNNCSTPQKPKRVIET